ncbi:hypothetical protein JCM8202_000140 [Rhodotorula sphaerocarpa]
MEDAAAAPAAPAPAPEAAMTKSALKRQRRQEHYQQQKLARRAAEKDKRKQKQREHRERVSQGLVDPDEDPSGAARKRQRRKEILKDKEPHPARLCIDMGFDSLMTDKEIKSMASQLAYCYSANRLSSRPFPLLITSFTGRIRDAYEKRGDWKSWKGVEWWEEGLEELYQGVADPDPTKVEQEKETGAQLEGRSGAEAEQTVGPAGTMTEEGAKAAAAPAAASASGEEATEASTSAATASTSAAPASASDTTSDLTAPPIALGSLAGQPRARTPRSQVVYLTGDSPNILTSLEPNHTYILGGLVDRNRHKLLCLNKATNDLPEGGVRHAQLPIGEALPELKTRKVLTVNQVVEILVKWVDGGQVRGKEGWEEALRSVMPTRKFDAEGKKKRREARRNGRAASEAGEDESSEEEDEQGDEGGEVYVAQDDDDDDEEEEDQAMSNAPVEATPAAAGAGAEAEAPTATDAPAATAAVEGAEPAST